MDIKSVDEINGSGEYNISYTYNNKTYHFNIKVGDLGTNPSLNINGCGSGGQQDGRFYDAYLKDLNHNSIDIRFKYDSGGSITYPSGWEQALSTLTGEIAEKYNIDGSQTMMSGFSATAHGTLDLATTYAKTTKSNDFTAVIIEDCKPRTELTQSQRDTLANHNVTVINAWASGDRKRNEKVLESYKGIHMIDIQFSVKEGGNQHVTPHDVFAKYGLTNLGNGEFDFTDLPTEYVNRSGKTIHIDYVINEYYTDECIPSTSENGTDIIINDRQNEYVNNNLSLCQNNCSFTGYEQNSKKAIYDCEVK